MCYKVGGSGRLCHILGQMSKKRFIREHYATTEKIKYKHAELVLLHLDSHLSYVVESQRFVHAIVYFKMIS